MNITWYYGTDSTNINQLLSSTQNITNSTQTTHFYQSTQKATTYYIRINVNDGTQSTEEIIQYRTKGYPGAAGYIPTSNYIYLAVLSLLGVIAFVFMFIKQNKDDDYFKR